VVCLDEKPVTLHADVRSSQPAKPGREARRDNEYKRCGTANVFCAVEPKAGKHFTFPTARRTAGQFRPGRPHSGRALLGSKTIHLVMDNLNIHGRKSLIDFYGEQPAALSGIGSPCTTTPKHGSWLNQAEIEIGLFSRQCLGQRRIPDLPTLRSESRAWNRRINRVGVTINWKFDRKAARKKFGYTTNSFTRSKN